METNRFGGCETSTADDKSMLIATSELAICMKILNGVEEANDQVVYDFLMAKQSRTLRKSIFAPLSLNCLWGKRKKLNLSNHVAIND